MDRLCKLTLLLHCLILLVILLYQDLKYPKKGGFQFFDQVTPDFWGVENTPHRTIFLTILNIPYRVIILCGWAVYINFMVIVHHQDHKYPKIGGFQFFDLVTPHFWGGEKSPSYIFDNNDFPLQRFNLVRKGYVNNLYCYIA